MLAKVIFSAVLTLVPMAAIADGRLERCEPYRERVQEILMWQGLSPDFYYLMVAESGCRTDAKSNKGAVGFWQLMPTTARHYGLTVTRGADDRTDWEKSTIAATRYLLHLSTMFNDFDDVIRAYNMGGHNLRRYGATKAAEDLAWTVRELLCKR